MVNNTGLRGISVLNTPQGIECKRVMPADSKHLSMSFRFPHQLDLEDNTFLLGTKVLVLCPQTDVFKVLRSRAAISGRARMPLAAWTLRKARRTARFLFCVAEPMRLLSDLMTLMNRKHSVLSSLAAALHAELQHFTFSSLHLTSPHIHLTSPANPVKKKIIEEMYTCPAWE